jgi:hypothetical protein
MICTGITNFRVDVGALTLIGPAPLTQSRTCVSGQTCAFDSLSGQLLSDADRLMVLETCGDAALVFRFSDVGFVTGLKASGAAVTWGSTPLTSAGGEYRLCWCAGVPGENVVMSEDSNGTASFSSVLPDSTADQYTAACSSDSNLSSSNGTCTGLVRQIGVPCDRPSEFRVDLGELRVMGPTPLTQTRTCIAGLTCAVDGPLGVDTFPPVMTSVLKVRIAQYGNGANDVTRYSIAASSHPDAASAPSPGPMLYVEIATCEPNLTDTSTWHVCEGFPVTQAKYWRIVILDVEGGYGSFPMLREIQFYAMLQNAEPQWIVPPGGASSVIYSEGSVTSGYEIANIFDGDLTTYWNPGFGGLTEWEFKMQFFTEGTGDLMIVLDTCGSDRVIPGFETPAAVQDDAILTSFSTVRWTWGSAVVTAAGGIYQLCWCAGHQFDCSAAEHFRTTVGDFTVVGPYDAHRIRSEQDRTCISGLTCAIHGISGQWLSDSDSFMVLQTCGDADETLIPRFPKKGLGGLTLKSGAGVNWGSAFVTSPGGQYRLCWCWNGVTCTQAEAFRVDVGRFTVIGVSPMTQDRTCVSGQTCSFHNLKGQDLSF